MKTNLGRIVILVDDYDKAYEFYERNFFCKKLHDSETPTGQRYLHIAFSEDDGVGLWLLKAESEEQIKQIGRQTAGQPTLVVYTDDCQSLYEHLIKNNVEILEELAKTPQSKFFHCKDLYGNRITVVELI